jgi:UDP-galactose transporter
MGTGWLTGKRYSRLQVFSVFVLTAGVVISAWADAQSKVTLSVKHFVDQILTKALQGKSMDTNAIDFRDARFELGLLILLVAQLLSSYMGIYVQDTYEQYGNHWDENLFYSHLFSLPLFFPLQGMLRSQYRRLQTSAPFDLPPALSAMLPSAAQMLLRSVPKSLVYLGMNSLTQLICITGVNLLGACSSAVTVTIVLNIRKLVSFMLSIWLFGNKLSGLMLIGSTLVFGSGALYGWETTVGIKRRRMKAESQTNGHVKKD